MLGLKLPTDPRWAHIAEKNIEEILIDHAWCEQKAASMAISIIVTNPDKTELIHEMTDLVREEMGHFKMVMHKLKEYGFELGPQRPDEYVKKIQQFFPKGGSRTDGLVHHLLVAALIEARSCERFRLLSIELTDEKLRSFYHTFMVSEAGHYSLFMDLACHYIDEKRVKKRWQEYLEAEVEILDRIEIKGEKIH